MAEYAHPEVLVSTQWVAEQSSSGGPNSKIRLIEVDVDTSAYEQYEKQEGDFVEGEPSSTEEVPAPVTGEDETPTK